ncbi:MAG: sulfite exporter TauE/SafE family protein [Pseudomonadota bacterium]
MTELLNLGPAELTALAGIAFIAGVIRGFTGFALSAVAMTAAVFYLPPVEIIPMLWWLEITASVLMIRSGWTEADKRIGFGLAAGSVIGLPLGLWLTLSIPQDVSKIAALVLISALAATQLARLRLPFLATRVGLGASGLTAGITTGLSGAGGMVVALYTLALDKPGRVIRASLILYLTVSLCVSFFTHLIIGTMDATAIWRGLVLAVPTAAGVVLGKWMFIPRYEPYYKPICLVLLIALALAGLAREFAT